MPKAVIIGGVIVSLSRFFFRYRNGDNGNPTVEKFINRVLYTHVGNLPHSLATQGSHKRLTCEIWQLILGVSKL